MPKHICRFPPEGRLFQQQRRAGEGGEVAQTKLLPRHFGMALACAMGLSFLAAFGPALKSTRIQPSEVIRDV